MTVLLVYFYLQNSNQQNNKKPCWGGRCWGGGDGQLPFPYPLDAILIHCTYSLQIVRPSRLMVVQVLRLLKFCLGVVGQSLLSEISS